MDPKNIQNNCLQKLLVLPLRQLVKKYKLEKANIKTGAEEGLFLWIKEENRPIRFTIEVTGVLKRPLPTHWGLAEKRKAKNLLVMAQYVNDVIGDDMRRNGIHYIDCLGNAYINVPGRLYVDVQGKKPPKKQEKQTALLFQTKGMQLLFLLLTEPDVVNETLRVLSLKAGVSLERAYTVFQELKKKGYIQATNQGRNLLWNREKLFKQWLANFGDRLRPKLVLGAYKIAPSAMEQAPELLRKAFPNDNGNYAIGGGLAGDLLMHYYRGPTTEIFVRPDQAEKVCRTLKLIPARETNATLLNLFTPTVIYQKQNLLYPIAHPLLIYAELLYQGGDRAAEAAGQIFDTYLKPDFNET